MTIARGSSTKNIVNIVNASYNCFFVHGVIVTRRTTPNFPAIEPRAGLLYGVMTSKHYIWFLVVDDGVDCFLMNLSHAVYRSRV